MSLQPTADQQAHLRYEYHRLHPEHDKANRHLGFAIVLLSIAGALNIIGGLGAVNDSKFFAHDVHYVIGSLNTWGWVVTVVGVLQLVVAYGVAARNQLARWTALVCLALNSVVQLLMIPAYPFWCLAIFALNVIAIHGLIAYGQKPER